MNVTYLIPYTLLQYTLVTLVGIKPFPAPSTTDAHLESASTILFWINSYAHCDSDYTKTSASSKLFRDSRVLKA